MNFIIGPAPLKRKEARLSHVCIDIKSTAADNHAELTQTWAHYAYCPCPDHMIIKKTMKNGIFALTIPHSSVHYKDQ